MAKSRASLFMMVWGYFARNASIFLARSPGSWVLNATIYSLYATGSLIVFVGACAAAGGCAVGGGCAVAGCCDAAGCGLVVLLFATPATVSASTRVTSTLFIHCSFILKRAAAPSAPAALRDCLPLVREEEDYKRQTPVLGKQVSSIHTSCLCDSCKAFARRAGPARNR